MNASTYFSTFLPTCSLQVMFRGIFLPMILALIMCYVCVCASPAAFLLCAIYRLAAWRVPFVPLIFAIVFIKGQVD